jgi:hypothetical protein
MKTQAQLLKAYKKANKERREKIANNAGFNSGDEYENHLQEQISKQVDTPLVIHNIHILDRSSSMNSGGRIYSALQGINSEIEELKKDSSVTYLQTFVPFSYGNYSGRIGNEFFKTPINEVETINTFASGYTALYQALGETLEDVLASKGPNEKVLVKVFTDGEENDSRGLYRSGAALLELIKQAEKRDVTVTFVGTERDVLQVISTLGIERSNTMSHDNTPDGITRAFAATASATKTYAMKSLAGEDTLKGFYKEEGKLT